MIKLAIMKSGSQGMKVSRIDTTLGRTIRMFVSKNADLVAAEQACANYLFRAAQNEELSLEFQKAAAEAYQNFLWKQAAPVANTAPAAEPSPEPAAVEPVDATVAMFKKAAQRLNDQFKADPRSFIFDPALYPGRMEQLREMAEEEDYQRDSFLGNGTANYDGFTCKCGVVVKDEGQSCGSCASDAVMYNFSR